MKTQEIPTIEAAFSPSYESRNTAVEQQTPEACEQKQHHHLSYDIFHKSALMHSITKPHSVPLSLWPHHRGGDGARRRQQEEAAGEAVIAR